MIVYAFLFLVLGFVYYHLHHKRRNLPPGPIPLPIFGNLLDVFRDPPGEAVFGRWAEQFGPVYTYWMGDLPVVAVTDYELIMDTFQKDGDTFAGRYLFDEFNAMVRVELDLISQLVLGGPYGVIFTEGSLWFEQRRFALRVLRDFGLGKNLMQERVLDEVSTIFTSIDQEITAGNQEHDLYFHVDLAVGSIINALLFGYRFHGAKRDEFFDLKSRAKKHITITGHPLVLMSMQAPHFYRRLPFFGHYLKEMAETGDYLLNFFRDRVREHQRNFDADQPPEDFVYAFLLEWQKRERGGEVHYFSEPQLLSMCYDLWLAGQETTSNTLAWGFAFLIHHPDVQAELHAELDRVIGSDRLVTLNDRAALPYCNAVVLEMQRTANLVTQNIWRKATKDVKINGLHVPKGTAIVPQISVVLSDNKVYANPKRFDPTRFLDENGKLKKTDELISFSIGKRQCLGEGLARMELFSFLINILNRYRLLPGAQKPNLTRRCGATVNCDQYTCRIEKRVPT